MEAPSSAGVSIYLGQLARTGAKLSTIKRRLAAINYRLRMSREPPLSARDEPLASFLRGVRRDIGAPARQARPIEVAELRGLAAGCALNSKGMRDRTLVLLGFASALRRSELVGLDWSDAGDGTGWIEAVPEGLRNIGAAVRVVLDLKGVLGRRALESEGCSRPDGTKPV